MRIVFIIVIVFVTTFSVLAQKGKLFIIGGGKRPPFMIERMLKEAEIQRNDYVVILPMASEDPDSAVYFAKQQFFENNVLTVVGFNFKNGSEIPETRLDSVVNAKLVYIAGGDQSRFMEAIEKSSIKDAILKSYQKGNMIAGTSAGAAVMSKLMITGNELKHTEYKETFRTIDESNIELKSGLGFLEKAVIDQHFIQRSRYNRLLSIVIEHPEVAGVGIDEATAILVKNNKAEVIGDAQVIVVENPSKSKKVEKGKLGGRNLRISVYLPGEKFNIK